ncbi:MAG: hypothetical protein GY863_20365 [bacterium]|nr:hypothetical protein [bacterium]
MSPKFDKGKKNILKIIFGKRIRERITTDDLIFFTEQMKVMFKAGFLLSTTMNVLEDKTDSKILKNAILTISLDLEKGHTLSSTLEKYPEIFPEYYIKNIKAAEASGTLQDTLGRMANYLKAQIKLNYELKKTFFYPKILFAFILIGMLVLYMIKTYGLGGFIPEIFALMTFQNCLLAAGTIIAAVLFWDITKGFFTQWKGKVIWDKFRLNMWFLKGLYRDMLHKQFGEMFLSLCNSGLFIGEILYLTGDAVENKIYGRELKYIADRFESEYNISDAVNQNFYLPFKLKQIFHIGEETGEFDKNIRFYVMQLEGEIQRKARRIMQNAYFLILFIAVAMISWMRGQCRIVGNKMGSRFRPKRRGRLGTTIFCDEFKLTNLIDPWC